MADETEPIRVYESWWIKAVGLFGFIFFAVFAWLSRTIASGPMWYTIVFLLFALFEGFLFIISSSTLDANFDALTVRTPWGAYCMAWADVRFVETDGGSYILHGEDKRLSFNLSTAGKGKREFLLLFQQLTAERDIPVVPARKPIPFLRQKNTRIK